MLQKFFPDGTAYGLVPTNRGPSSFAFLTCEWHESCVNMNWGMSEMLNHKSQDAGRMPFKSGPK